MYDPILILNYRGCCVVVAVLCEGSELFVANVGDCRAVMFSRDNADNVNSIDNSNGKSTSRRGSLIFSTSEDRDSSEIKGRAEASSPSKKRGKFGEESLELSIETNSNGNLKGEFAEKLIEVKSPKSSSSVKADKHRSAHTSFSVFDPYFRCKDASPNKSTSPSADNVGVQPSTKSSNSEGAIMEVNLDADHGFEHFSFYKDGFSIGAVSWDHSLTNKLERKLLKQRTTDPNPLRCAMRDKDKKGNFERVAGSLMVTRALGDGYLKWKDIR